MGVRGEGTALFRPGFWAAPRRQDRRASGISTVHRPPKIDSAVACEATFDAEVLVKG